MFWYSVSLLVVCIVGVVSGLSVQDCPGYVASNITQVGAALRADLRLAGPACNIYGEDLSDLKLEVDYETDTRVHIKIYDVDQNVYQVPESVFPRPAYDASTTTNVSVDFVIVDDPFSFAIQRTSNSKTIFNSSGSNLIFESQYLRLRTSLPPDPNIYGLGEHTDSFRLNTTNYTRTLWSHDAYTIPPGSNLYGNHPVYFEHREDTNETHGVFLLNSNGMDIKINNTSEDGQYLEYNTLGGVVDMYVVTGPSPLDVARQYSEVVGKAAMMPYWGFGFHQCKYGYQDYLELAEVVANYSLADIPLETMWTDIDYMDARKIFSLDSQRFPLEKMRELIDYLHEHDQHYIVMVDPAVAYQDYGPFNRGDEQGIFMKNSNGSIFKGVVWPGVTAFPDWFNDNTQAYWTDEFAMFFNASSGIDIDSLWIDMNEISNFCFYPCDDPEGFALDNDYPPAPPPVRSATQQIPGFPADFQPPDAGLTRRQTGPGSMSGLPGRDLINPPYMIKNAPGSLSNSTLFTDLVHANGLVEYDTHNLYGTMMSTASREAMLNRRPDKRPMVITRSTFAGAGSKVGHWLGDNTATWEEYRISIAGMLGFASIYQVPMVGSDVCGYAQNTTETLCARWATLGAFYPFYRNHAAIDSISHEFYRWSTVADAARGAIKTRYRLLDYIYTAMHQQSVDGTPLLNPLWYLYPQDPNTLGIDLQFFYGPSLLVSPVTNENVTDVTFYVPEGPFYDYSTLQPVQSSGTTMTLNDVDYTSIPVHIRGGSIIPLRVDGANTTTALRQLDFELLVAPGADGHAAGNLYLDDGESLNQTTTSEIAFAYDGKTLAMSGTFAYDVGGIKIASVTVLGASQAPKQCMMDGSNIPSEQISYNSTSMSFTVQIGASLMQGFSLTIS
ncbi:MAG: hypothetical protein M4579_005410 [Chaenotheca gracillima]|nr:MAG: hypothetical protein M4579_005410 [Chaenotheca gracillima]